MYLETNLWEENYTNTVTNVPLGLYLPYLTYISVIQFLHKIPTISNYGHDYILQESSGKVVSTGHSKLVIVNIIIAERSTKVAIGIRKRSGER